MNAPTKFFVRYCGEKLETLPTLKEAKDFISLHPDYKKSYYTKKGYASSKNPNEKASFIITDNNGDAWYIK